MNCFQKRKKQGTEAVICFRKINKGDFFTNLDVCQDIKPLNVVLYNRIVFSEGVQHFGIFKKS